MQEKENARRAWKHGRAYVREHSDTIPRFGLRGEELPMTRRQELMVGALFTACGLAIVLLAGVFA